MKKTLFSFLLATLLPQAFTPAHATPYQGSRIFWDLTSRRQVFPNGNYARIIQLKDGRLLATCENNGIVIAFSSDKGATWSTPTRIVENTNNIPNCVPDLIQLADGTIIIAYNPRPSKPYTEDRKFGIRCKRSTDNGVSWSKEIFVNDAQHTFEDGCWEPSMLQLPSGELQLYFADEGPYTTSNEQQISLSRSFDGGLTWSAPQKVSFRASHRDGMPSPVLLADQSSIVVAIEDNGWEGIDDFFPTTVRCSLTDNWSNGYFVDANSENRHKAHNVKEAHGGAPYLRVLPWGETVLSWQSKYNNGDHYNMLTAVGDEKAENFHAISNPFRIENTQQGMWNSVAVIDTGVVAAVSSIGGVIEMIKGYPMRQFEATKGTPQIDGKTTLKEGYVQAAANQVKMGAQTGTRSTADFAYDSDNLYFIAKVTDRTPFLNVAQGDGVRLLIDTNGEPADRISETTFMIFLRRDGKLQAWRGNNGQWKAIDTEGFTLQTVSTNASYTVEASIPWNKLSLEIAPTDKLISTNIEVQDRQQTTTLTERIPDARQTIPSTWMRFHLQSDGGTSGIKQTDSGMQQIHIVAKANSLDIKSAKAMKKVDVYSSAGMLLASFTTNDTHLHKPLDANGMLLIKTWFDDDTTTVRKIVANNI